MLVYNYHPITKEFLSTETPFKDPETSGEFLVPKYATLLPTPELQKNTVAIFNGSDWDVVEDFRGLTFFNKESNSEEVISFFGKLPDNYIPLTSKKAKEALKLKNLNQLRESKISECIIQYGKLVSKLHKEGDYFVSASLLDDYLKINSLMSEDIKDGVLDDKYSVHVFNKDGVVQVLDTDYELFSKLFKKVRELSKKLIFKKNSNISFISSASMGELESFTISEANFD